MSLVGFGFVERLDSFHNEFLNCFVGFKYVFDKRRLKQELANLDTDAAQRILKVKTVELVITHARLERALLTLKSIGFGDILFTDSIGVLIDLRANLSVDIFFGKDEF